VVARLPVRPFFRDPSGTDTWKSVELIGDIDEALARLATLIEQDHRDNAAEVGAFAHMEPLLGGPHHLTCLEGRRGPASYEVSQKSAECSLSACYAYNTMGLTRR